MPTTKAYNARTVRPKLKPADFTTAHSPPSATAHAAASPNAAACFENKPSLKVTIHLRIDIPTISEALPHSTLAKLAATKTRTNKQATLLLATHPCQQLGLILYIAMDYF